jgi:hypothetical protein
MKDKYINTMIVMLIAIVGLLAFCQQTRGADIPPGYEYTYYTIPQGTHVYIYNETLNRWEGASAARDIMVKKFYNQFTPEQISKLDAKIDGDWSDMAVFYDGKDMVLARMRDVKLEGKPSDLIKEE